MTEAVKQRDVAQATRRRLLAKLCRERAKNLDSSLPAARSSYRMGDCSVSYPNRLFRNSEWFFRTADAIESGKPLEYFRRLGEDKTK